MSPLHSPSDCVKGEGGVGMAEEVRGESTGSGGDEVRSQILLDHLHKAWHKIGRCLNLHTGCMEECSVGLFQLHPTTPIHLSIYLCLPNCLKANVKAGSQLKWAILYRPARNWERLGAGRQRGLGLQVAMITLQYVHQWDDEINISVRLHFHINA